MKKISAPFAAAALRHARCWRAFTRMPAPRRTPSPAIDAHYGAVIEAYTQDMAAAKTKYDGKRLVFVGAVIRMGSDPGGTYFGALTKDGEQFDTHFDAGCAEAEIPRRRDQAVRHVGGVPLQLRERRLYRCAGAAGVEALALQARQLTCAGAVAGVQNFCWMPAITPSWFIPVPTVPPAATAFAASVLLNM